MTNIHSYNPFYGYESKKVEEAKAKAAATPTGTVPEMLSWVGDDKDRAKRALDQELAHSKPRKSLVSDLEDIING